MELLRRRDEALTARLEDEVVMLDPKLGYYFSLNSTPDRAEATTDHLAVKPTKKRGPPASA